jgi:hypothetical protein
VPKLLAVAVGGEAACHAVEEGRMPSGATA